MALDPNHIWSLDRAGIGSIFHNKSLRTDFGPEGVQLAEWVQANRARVAAGHSVIMTGIRSRELIVMMARAYHLNKLGVYVTPLVRIGGVLFDDKIKEQVYDNDILVITGFQQEGECPLKPSLLYETEHLINDRSDRGKTTFLNIPLGDEQQGFEIDNFDKWWWSIELVNTLIDRYEIIDMCGRSQS